MLRLTYSNKKNPWYFTVNFGIKSLNFVNYFIRIIYKQVNRSVVLTYIYYFHNRCSIGSLGWDTNEKGVRNVTVTTATFTGTQNGVRIKTWARPSNGFVNGVLFQHLTMVDVSNPIIIDQNYCPGSHDCPNKVRFLIRFSNA